MSKLVSALCHGCAPNTVLGSSCGHVLPLLSFCDPRGQEVDQHHGPYLSFGIQMSWVWIWAAVVHLGHCAPASSGTGG